METETEFLHDHCTFSVCFPLPPFLPPTFPPSLSLCVSWSLTHSYTHLTQTGIHAVINHSTFFHKWVQKHTSLFLHRAPRVWILEINLHQHRMLLPTQPSSSGSGKFTHTHTHTHSFIYTHQWAHIKTNYFLICH